MRFVSAVAATLILGPTIYLGAWGAKSVSLDWKIGFNAIALAGTLAAIPMTRLADEELREGEANRTRRNALRAADYAASTQQGISQIQQAYGIGKAPKWQADLLRDMGQMQALMGQIEAMGQQSPHLQPMEMGPARYEFDRILDEGTGIALLGNSGSGKSSVARYLVGMMGADTQVLVLDPHNDDCWGDLPVIWQIDQIAQQLQLLMAELRDRKDQRRRGPKVAIICDEWPAVRLEIKKLADEYILRAGSEFRKFGMLNIFCSQSGNVGALGLEGRGDFLENYQLIRLNKIARKFARNLPDQSILATLKNEAYCCMVGDEVSTHPTHSGYEVARNGNTPRNLRQLVAPPLTIPNVFDAGVTRAPNTSVDSRDTSTPHQLTPLPHQHPGPNTGVAGDPSDEAITPEERHAVIQLHRIGYSQNKTILQVWGIPKGTNAKYANCRAKYRQILADIGELEDA